MGELPGKALMIEAALDFGSSRAGVVLANRRPEAAEAAMEPRRAAVDGAVRARVLIANDMAVTGPCGGVFAVGWSVCEECGGKEKEKITLALLRWLLLASLTAYLSLQRGILI